MDLAGQQAECVGMGAEDAQCGLLYRAEKATRAREAGLMLMEEQMVRAL